MYLLQARSVLTHIHVSEKSGLGHEFTSCSPVWTSQRGQFRTFGHMRRCNGLTRSSLFLGIGILVSHVNTLISPGSENAGQVSISKPCFLYRTQ